jgi:hypothetical protein
MKPVAAAILLLGLCGCAVTPPQGTGKMTAVTGGERIEIVAPVRIIETRGPLALKLGWLLLPGVYVERYASPSGRIFLSEGRLVQFTSTLGDKQMSWGGFITSKDRPGIGKLYIAKEYYGRPQRLEAFLAGKAPDEGELFQVTDFSLSDLKRR